MPEKYPATEDTISNVVTRTQVEEKGKDDEYLNSDLSGRVLFADEIMEISERLSNIQDIFEKNLRTIISTIYSSSSTTRIIWESPDCYVVVDHDKIIQKGLEAQTEFGISDELLEIHSITASNKLSNHPDINIDQGQPWVISKPAKWSQSEWSTDTYLTTLIKAGLSPTQAIDYWMVERRKKYLPYWAELRGTSGQAIRENIKKAKNKIESYDPPESYSAEEYFQRTYRGKTIDETTTEVTVDGGYLPPRLDVYSHAKSGKYAWGYKGAGPTQLAFAILRDALDEDEITHDKVISFRDHLNSKINNNSEWEYSELEVHEWNQKFESDKKD
jgi:hypothetical protein